MSPDGFAQVFTYETRIEMAPGSADGRPQATFARRLLKVQGPVPRMGGKKKPDEGTTNAEGEPEADVRSGLDHPGKDLEPFFESGNGQE